MMETILQHLDNQAWHRLVTALLHTLWQAPIIALMMVVLLRGVSTQCSQTRYLITLSGLVSVLLIGLITHGILHVQGRDVGSQAEVIETTHGIDVAGATDGVSENFAMSHAGSKSSADRMIQEDQSATPFDPALSPRFWKPVAAAVWILGVGVMLIRTGIGLIVLRRRAAEGSGEAVPDWVGGQLDKLIAAMGITRHVRVIMTERLSSPAVMGVIWPTLLLPPATLMGLTPEQLRVILAHELAHIRRHDYLVNLIQKLIEALFFFNPAVWWISRQIRIEREACCDDLAARVVGDRPAVARTLYEVAAKATGSGPLTDSLAPAFGQKNRGSMLLDRVRRIVHPSHAPAIRLPWYTFVLLVVVVLAGVYLADRGVNKAVTVAAEALSGPEHVKRIAEIEAEYGEADRSRHRELTDEEHVRLAGTVRTHDGKPLPEKTYVLLRSEYPGGTTANGAMISPQGTWSSDQIEPGQTTVTTYADGYASAVAGPFNLAAGAVKESIDLVLTEGFSMKLRVLSESDQPLADVPIDLRLQSDGAYAGERKVQTDENGIAVVDRLIQCELKVNITQPGYQRLEQTIDPAPNAMEVLRLQPSRPVTGQVVSAETGKPVPNAKVRLVFRDNSCTDPRKDYNRKQPPFAMADDEGRFVLDTLESGVTYTFWFEAPGYRPEIVYGIVEGMEGLTVRLQEPIVIQVEVIGPLDDLPKNDDGKPFIRYSQSLRCSSDHTYSGSGSAVVETKDDKQTAVLDELILPGPLTIQTPDDHRSVRVEDAAEVDHVVLDLRPEAAPETRTVIVMVIPPEGWPTPKGRIRVDYVAPGSRGYRPFYLDLEKGQASIEVPLNENGIGKFRYGPIYAPGYWIEEKSEISIPAGKDPYVIEIAAQPAGSVYGVVLNANGEPHVHATVSLNVIERPDDQTRVDSNLLRCETDINGRFAIDQVPLGGRYRPVPWDHRIGHERRAWGEVIEINREQPTHEVKLVIPAGVEVPVQVLGPDGEPVAGAGVALNFRTPEGGHGGATRRCDGQGRYTFKGVNFDAPGTYNISVEPTRTLAGARVDVDPNQPATTIRMVAGVRLEGVLINHETDEPIGGKIVEAYPTDFSVDPYGLRIQTGTDDQGRFVFENLHPITYRLRVDNTVPPSGRVTKLPSGGVSIRYPANADETSTVKLPRETDEPFELRVIPY